MSSAPRVNGVVPLAMEAMGHEVERGHLGIRHVVAFRIGPTVEFTSHSQSGRGAGGADQIHTASLTSSWPRQLLLMYEKSRCSILFPLLVPGGR